MRNFLQTLPAVVRPVTAPDTGDQAVVLQQIQVLVRVRGQRAPFRSGAVPVRRNKALNWFTNRFAILNRFTNRLGAINFIFNFYGAVYASLKHSKQHCSSDGLLEVHQD